MTEVVQEAQDDQPKYIIEEITVEGAEGRLVKTEDDRPLFKVSTTFTDEQVAEVYALADQFFAQGHQVGVQALQGNLQSLLGLKVVTQGEQQEDPEETSE